MFRDRDPRRRNSGNSPFFSSQTPIDSPRALEEFQVVRERITRKRKPLHQRTSSQNNERPPTRRSTESDADKPSVRLVRPSPAPPGRKSIDDDEHVRPRHAATRTELAKSRLSNPADVQPPSASEPGFPPASRVSDLQSDTSWTHARDVSSNVTASPEISTEAVPKSPLQWPSTSSRFSNSSTLRGNDSTVDSWFGSDRSRYSRNSRAVRLSEGTTLRGTPEPFDHLQHLSDTDKPGSSSPQDLAPVLQTLQERSPEQSASPPNPTVRAVRPSPSTSSSGRTARLRRHASDSSLPRLRLRASTIGPDSQTHTPQSHGSSRSSSINSLPLPLTVRPTEHELRDYSSRESFLRSDSVLPTPSTPNFVAYTDTSRTPRSGHPERPTNPVLRDQPSQASLAPSDFDVLTSSPNFFAYADSSRPASPHRRSLERPGNPVLRDQSSQDSFAHVRSRYPSTSLPNVVPYTDSSRPASDLHHYASYESIQSRLDRASPSSGEPRSSLQRSSSLDTLPPLQVPRKRPLRKKRSRSMDLEEVDTQPWPRQGFSSHLSTIASESSRSTQQMSHFSLGSGVLTGDDSSSIPLSRFSRRESAPMPSPVSETVPGQSPSSEEAGDMTMGLYRAESAKPEPLFRERQTSAPDTSRRYDGPLPPIPPIPMTSYSDEHGDRLGELGAPSLRQKRSGYSVRNRSNSTPSHSRHNSQISYDESERWSHGSSIFPVWAKNFYGGNANLLSSSKVSLTMPPEPQRNNSQHARNASQWTDRSITSRLGTGYSEIETASPLSSHFLPSIFRPRNRTRAKSDTANRSSKHSKKSKTSRPSQDSAHSHANSLAIFQNPFPSGDPETLPSGQPKYGALKDADPDPDAPPLPPLPRKYSKQKHWDTMQFPRPMTKDRLSEFDQSPNSPAHLAPSKRQSHRLSAWRTPSFVESLDTLFHSRGNRQILLFAIGFVFPFAWMLGALLPLPPRPGRDAAEAEKALAGRGSQEDVQMALRRHEAGDARARWAEERLWLKAKWWRTLNRVMCLVGLGVIGAVIALAVVATR